MDYDMTFFFRQYWTDPRLAWAGESNRTRSDGFNKIHSSYAERIWVPDLFFVDEKEAKRHEILRRNALLEIKPNGEIFYSGLLDSFKFNTGCLGIVRTTNASHF